VLEFPGSGLPSIQEIIDRVVTAGTRHLIALPALLHEAGHSKHDMPAQVEAALQRHPHLRVSSRRSLGIHPWLLDIVDERASAAEGARSQQADPIDGRTASRDPAGDTTQTALLLAGRGSSDPEANADFYRVGRLLWERKRYGLVECCFVSLAGPRVAEGIERCVRLGAGRVLVVPYFLSTGVLVKRIGAQARSASAEHPGIQIVVGEHLGVHPKLVQMIVEQARSLSVANPGPPDGDNAQWPEETDPLVTTGHGLADAGDERRRVVSSFATVDPVGA
jgi:sirohydrochlorin cobaltochelatase